MSAYGVRIGIRVSESGMMDDVVGQLPPGWKPASSPSVGQMYSLIVGGSGTRPGVRRLFLAYRGSLRIAREREATPMFDALKADLRLWVAERAPRRVFVHAGVVEWNGRAIVIPGRSYSGKSTLVAELLEAGATYYSDEYAVIDAKGLVHPFPVPVGMREPGGYASMPQPVSAFGATIGSKPIPVGLITSSRFRAGGSWRPRRLTPGQGVLELLANTVSARRKPDKVLSTLRAAVTGATVVKGSRGEASEVAARVLDLAESSMSTRTA